MLSEEQIKQKAEEYAINMWGNDEAFIDERNNCKQDYLAGATENGVIVHNLKENPDDLPKCDESKPITFYVEEWIESIQKYKKRYCLGFYKNSFMNDDVKVFVEKSIGYENEHLPKTVLFWYENPTV